MPSHASVPPSRRYRFATSMKLASLSIALAVGTAAAAAENPALYPTKDCGKLTTQMDLNSCAGANLKAADAVLNKIYQRLMARQKNKTAKERLKDLERAWISFRDRECGREVGSQEDGGSAWPMEMSNCLEEKTAARIRELIALEKCAVGIGKCSSR